MPKPPYEPGKTVNAICFLASTAFLLWVFRSGALAMWDRYAPVHKEGPVLPWIIALPIAVVGGAVIMPLLTFQISVLVDWWRKRRGES
jgi:hypothetical protein